MDNKRNIVLASQSPRRRELLERLIPEFKILVDNSDEVVEDGVPPEETVRRLALQKATNVADKADNDALIIAADTMVFINGKVLGKPANETEARDMLRILSGREHYVCTGIAVVDKKNDKTFCDFERTVVHFKPLSDEEIEKYIKSGEPMDNSAVPIWNSKKNTIPEWADKAGAYGIQDIGALFVDWIKGDYFNVVGLPICKLAQVLKREFEYEIF